MPGGPLEQERVYRTVIPVGGHQVTIGHLNVAPGHLKGCVAEEPLQVKRAHPGAKAESGEGPPEHVGTEFNASSTT